MADEDLEYLVHYRPDHIYTVPAKNGSGAYVKLVGDSEEFIAEIDVTDRCKLAVSAFYVKSSRDFGTLKITKLQHNKRNGWRVDSELTVNSFQATQMMEFVSIISSLNLEDAKKTRISLENIHIGALGALLTSTQGAALVSKLAASPELHHDIYAVASKRAALKEFEHLLASRLSEREWQAFFERNPWIFGHGLNYVFLGKAGKKLESTTTGSAFDRAGKRADGLLLTKAEVSQYVLVEIKTNNTDLLQETEYRSGCWGVSDELSKAVTQVQKTAFEFGRDRFRQPLKDNLGNDTGKTVYSIEPRSYLVIGNLSQLAGNDDRIACFELYRRNVRSPEILTFDELFYRAGFIVENISRETELAADEENIDEIPF